jgi:hypothetical protein
MKTLILKFFALLLILNSNLTLFSQEIQISSIFTSDTVLFPFDQIDMVSSMTIEGEVHLHHDTSLVRVILEDDYGYQYMILEAYPLIIADSIFTFTRHCDETCLLDQANPYSLNIQIIDGSLNFKSLYYDKDPKENSSEERYKAKRALDAIKIEIMNQVIPSLQMDWTAGDNDIVAKYYDQKRRMFGDKFNLIGFDYYRGGVFKFAGDANYPKVDPDIVRRFDWRERHGANDSLSIHYYDGDALGTGWFTSVKNQMTCGGCWAFSALGLTEVIANLFSAQHIDYDLSEQDLICNSSAGSCHGGSDSLGLIYGKNHGFVTENCYRYDTIDFDDSCRIHCNNPDTIIKIFNVDSYFTDDERNYDSIRIHLIKYGPLGFSYQINDSTGHAVVLSGFEFIPKDSTLFWIIKNSWGTTWGDNGFGSLQLEDFNSATRLIPPIYYNNEIIDSQCEDYDNDGFCFWGLGERPENCNCQEELEDCDDNDPYVGGYDENFNCGCIFKMDTIAHHISVNTTWSDTTYHINYQVVIDSGACLTIRTKAEFAPEAGIQVKQGGKLILDSAYLTKVCPELWKGIEVLGSDTAQGFDQYFGQVTMRNNAIIEFAKIGIANYCTLCDSTSMQSGGLIYADSSIFRNNETDVFLAPFKNLWLGNELPYYSSFVKCQFKTTEAFYLDFLPEAHVKLNDIRALTFYGCTFKNESDLSDYPYPMRGIGISSIDANFTLLEYCNTPNIIPCNNLITCEFENLEYGIKALNSTSVKTLNIQKVVFKDNLVGISLSGIDYASVLSNDFQCPTDSTFEKYNRFCGGLFMEGCTGYHVENNFFHGILGSFGSLSKGYGIGVKNSGADNNEIYNNDFFRVKTGIIAIGENRGRDTSGLCLKCNEMSSNINDFIVVTDDGPRAGIQGIHLFQGNPNDTISITAPAGNTFTDFGGTPANEGKYYNYLNDAEDIYYLHHSEHETYLVFPADSNYTKETIELQDQNIQFEKSRACPSDIGGGHLKSYLNPRQNIIEADNHIALLKNQLNTKVDGGNTEELNFEVMTSFPDEGLEVRQELLGESPYLSDTVLKQAIYKEDVLPNAMIRDIMEANPQSAKKDDLLEALDDRYDPMPDYMMAQVLEGKNYFGAKELLEAEIQSWQQVRSKAKNELIRQFLLDTNIVNSIDSVIAFLETENDLKSKYDLSFAYWNKRDSANARLTINNIPFQYTLSDDQSTVHQLYNNYFEILRQMEDSSWRACELDSSSVQDLFSLMEDGYVDIAAHARGLLVKGGFLNYIETVNIPDYTKSSRPHYISEDNSSKKPQQDLLRLFPNPAGDYVIAYYDVDSRFKYSVITINDMKGNLLRKYKVNSGINQIVLDLNNLPNGIYVVGLHANDQLLEIEKLSKGRN